MDYSTWTSERLREEHKRLSAIKAWRPVAEIEQEIKKRRPVELAQDSYYYGTAADLRGRG